MIPPRREVSLDTPHTVKGEPLRADPLCRKLRQQLLTEAWPRQALLHFAVDDQIAVLLVDREVSDRDSTDFPALLTVCTPDGAGGVHEQRLSVPAAPEQPFHRELADRVLSGEPMSVTPEGSRRNIAVMEAATASARDGGRPVEVAR